jgi:hypothetical protein
MYEYLCGSDKFALEHLPSRLLVSCSVAFAFLKGRGRGLAGDLPLAAQAHLSDGNVSKEQKNPHIMVGAGEVSVSEPKRMAWIFRFPKANSLLFFTLISPSFFILVLSSAWTSETPAGE